MLFNGDQIFHNKKSILYTTEIFLFGKYFCVLIEHSRLQSRRPLSEFCKGKRGGGFELLTLKTDKKRSGAEL